MGGGGGGIVMLGCMGFFLQRDYACNVETSEVQVRLCVCHPICVYIDHTFCHSCLLGIWRPAFDKCKCPSLAAQKRCSWSCCCSHANSSGNLKWFSANLTVDGYQGSKKKGFFLLSDVHPYKENACDWIVRCLQFITVGFAVTPLYFVWEKLIGIHTTKNMLLRAVCRMPVILPVWFFAIAFPFFGPINSMVGAMLVTFTVYIIPCAAHMSVFRTAKARQVKSSTSRKNHHQNGRLENLPVFLSVRRIHFKVLAHKKMTLKLMKWQSFSWLQNAVVRPPFFMSSWAAIYLINIFIVIWTMVIGIGWGGWASITTFKHEIKTFGVFAPCYQCPRTAAAATGSALNSTHHN